MKLYCEDVERALEQAQSSREGLTTAEAQKRLAANGKNKLAEAKKDSLIKRFFKQMADPMILILLAAALVSGVLAVVEGESFADVIIILAVVLINAVLGVYQENKAERAIEALQEMSAATSKVLRDGKVQIVRSEELVVGDVVLLEAGDAVPADGRLIECASLQIEESALTGESVPVTKLIDAINLAPEAKDVPLGDRKTWSTWAPAWPMAAAWRWSRPPAWTARWARSPTRWPRPRTVRPRCSASSASSPAC